MRSVDVAPRSPIPLESVSTTLADELTRIETVEIADEVHVGYSLLNRHLVGHQAAVVAIGGFLSSLGTADRAYEGLQLTALERPILMLDMPGHGLSTPHTRNQVVDLCFKRDATSQASPLVEATQRLLPDSYPVSYFGVSHGALLSLKCAELDPDERTETIFGIDLPAVKRRTTAGLQIGYLLRDNYFGYRRFRREIAGTSIEQDFEEFREFYVDLDVQQPKSFIRSNPGLFVLNLFSSINASPVGLWSWRAIMENTDARVCMYTSEKGSVSDPAEISEFINELPVEQRERSSQVVVANEDHNIGRVQLLPRAVEWAKHAYGN